MDVAAKDRVDVPIEGLTIAVVVPCLNEAAAIGSVIADSRAALPSAQVYVFDNGSTDATASVAAAAGAVVIPVGRRGKGNVVRRMFADVEADVYVMVDGDSTYDLSGMREHVLLLLSRRLDMVVGRRVDEGGDRRTYPAGHRWGNRLLTATVVRIFDGEFSDILSGYRIFSRRYVKTFPGAARGFEIETEMTVHALELRMPAAEVPVAYRIRPAGGASKLSTYRDGARILGTILKLFIHERPLGFFGGIAVLLAMLSTGLALPLLSTYLETGLVPRFPTAILAVGIMLSAMLCAVCGAVLDVVTGGRREAKLLAYLAIPAPPPWPAPAPVTVDASAAASAAAPREACPAQTKG